MRIAGIFCMWVLFLLLGSESKATTISSRAGSGNWSDTAHWSPAQIPTTSDSVIITSGNNMTVSGYNAYAKGLNIQSGATLTNKNTLTYALNLYGNLKVDGTYSCGGVTYETQVDFYGAGSHICGSGTISATYNCYFCIRANVTIDAGTTTSGSVDFILYGAVTLTNNGSVTSISGAYGISFNGGGGGTWTQGVNSYFGGHGIGGPNSGTLDASASGNTVEYSNLNSSIYPASPGYYNLKISGSTNYPAMVSNIQVLGDFTIASGGMTSSTYTMSLKGNWYNYGTAATNAGQPKMNFNGTGTQTIYKSSTPEYFNNFKLSGTSTVSPPSGGLEVNDLLINSGATFDMGSASLFEVFGNWTNYGTFYPRTSITYLCPYSGNTDTLYNAAGVENFYNFGKVNPGTTVLRSNVKISGGSSVLGVWGLYIGSGGGGYGTLDAGGGADTIFLAGNWDNTGGTFTARNGAVIFNASSGTQTISKASGATEYFNNLTVAGGGTALLAGPICALGDLTLTSGYLDVSTSNYLLSVGGNWTNTSGAFVPRSGSVDFVQQSGATKTVSKTGGMETFYNLNKSVAGTLKLGSNIQVTGSLSLNNGTLDGNTGSYTLYLTKDWDNTNTGGSFVCGNSTVYFQGTSGYQSVLKPGGTETFYNITTAASPNETDLFCTVICQNNLSIGGTMYLGNPLTVNNNLSIASTSTFHSNSEPITLGGNWTDNGTFTSSIPYVTFNGVSNQAINKSSGSEAFTKFAVNKSGGTVTLNCPLTIADTLNLTKGAIITTSSNVLKLNNGANLLGGSDSSYVSGPMDKVGNSAFTFPLGSTTLTSGAYHPLTITAPSSTTDEFVAQYYPTGQTYGSAADDSIQNLSTSEYWTLNRSVGSSIPQITLGWNSNNSLDDSYYDYRVVAWDGTAWRNKGNAAFTSSGVKGTVKTSTAVAYSPNPQPITISKIKFYAPFAVLRRKLDGGYTTINSHGILAFIYPEEYNDTDSKLTYNLYDKNNTVIASNATALSGFVPVVNYGDNRYGLNLLSSSLGLSSAITHGNNYVLEVINEKNEKWYLRAKY